MNREYIERLQRRNPGPLTATEKKLLQDMRFLINFVLDYDLGMDLVVEILNHDIQEIIRVGSIDKAVESCFLPKSHEFSNYE